MYQTITQIVNQKGVSYTQIKMHNALPLITEICRNDTKGSKPAFNEYIRAHFFYSEREFISIYKKCTRFLASAAMYTRSALLCSKLRNITVEGRPQKPTFSTNRLLWCGTVTFF